MTTFRHRIVIAHGTLATVVVVVVCGARALSQQPAVTNSDTSNRTVLAQQFLTVSGISDHHRTAITNALPKTKEATQSANDFWRDLTQEEIKLYAEVFTAEELQGLIAFYQSPAGKALREKQPQIAQRWERVRSEKALNFLERK